MVWNEEEKYPWMVRMVLKTGVVQTRKQAELLLLCAAFSFIAMALWATLRKTPPPLPPEQDPNYESVING